MMREEAVMVGGTGGSWQRWYICAHPHHFPHLLHFQFSRFRRATKNLYFKKSSLGESEEQPGFKTRDLGEKSHCAFPRGLLFP